MTSLQRVVVPLGERSYDVVVGHGAIAELAGLLPGTARKAAVVTQATVPCSIDLPLPVERIEIGVGESHKTFTTLELVARSFARIGLTRHDVVIAVGGGMVTDVAGFAAATWHRGMPVINVATTLLGMVDGAIGGKTAVNLPEGKNLVGSFWQPCGVICDLDALATLPSRERRSGDGEMAKYHFLTGEDLEAMDLTARVARCVVDQGGPGRRRRARGRPAGTAQLRTHAGPRAGDRHRSRADARGGGRNRAGVRRRAGPAAGPDRQRAGRGSSPGRRWHVRVAHEGAHRPRRRAS